MPPGPLSTFRLDGAVLQGRIGQIDRLQALLGLRVAAVGIGVQRLDQLDVARLDLHGIGIGIEIQYRQGLLVLARRLGRRARPRPVLEYVGEFPAQLVLDLAFVLRRRPPERPRRETLWQ